MADFSYYSNDGARTAGGNTAQYKSIQSWKSPKATKTVQLGTNQQGIINTLNKASIGRVGKFDAELKGITAYADANRPTQIISKNPPNESFKFADVIDVINPLQHLPVVNMVYRGITNDEIHPMSQIIGGALYGGPVGAVTGTANAITKVQSGKDIGEHMLSFAGLKTDKPILTSNNTENVLNNAAEKIENNLPLNRMPDDALGFASISEPVKAYKNTQQLTESRTAGNWNVQQKMIGYRQDVKSSILQEEHSQIIDKLNLNILPAKDGVTTMSISAMPVRQDA